MNALPERPTVYYWRPEGIGDAPYPENCAVHIGTNKLLDGWVTVEAYEKAETLITQLQGEVERLTVPPEFLDTRPTPLSLYDDDVERRVYDKAEMDQYTLAQAQQIATLTERLERARQGMQAIAIQRTSTEIVEEEGDDDGADYIGAYDIAIQAARAAIRSLNTGSKPSEEEQGE